MTKAELEAVIVGLQADLAAMRGAGTATLELPKTDAGTAETRLWEQGMDPLRGKPLTAFQQTVLGIPKGHVEEWASTIKVGPVARKVLILLAKSFRSARVNGRPLYGVHRSEVSTLAGGWDSWHVAKQELRAAHLVVDRGSYMSLGTGEEKGGRKAADPAQKYADGE